MERTSGKKGLITAVIVLVVVLIVGAAAYRAFAGSQAPSQSAAPQDAAADSASDVVTLAEFDCTVYTAKQEPMMLSTIADGKPLVINFWATWCPHCIDEMPDFQKLYEAYGDRIAFCMLDAVGTRDESLTKGASYVREEGFTFPVYYDMDGDGVKTYQVTGFPSTVVYDSNGQMVKYYVGRVNRQDVDSLLATLR